MEDFNQYAPWVFIIASAVKNFLPPPASKIASIIYKILVDIPSISLTKHANAAKIVK